MCQGKSREVCLQGLANESLTGPVCLHVYAVKCTCSVNVPVYSKPNMSQHLSTHSFDTLTCFSHVCPCVWACVAECVCESVPYHQLLNHSGSEIDGQCQPPLAWHSTKHTSYDVYYLMHYNFIYSIVSPLVFVEQDFSSSKRYFLLERGLRNELLIQILLTAWEKLHGD